MTRPLARRGSKFSTALAASSSSALSRIISQPGLSLSQPRTASICSASFKPGRFRYFSSAREAREAFRRSSVSALTKKTAGAFLFSHTHQPNSIARRVFPIPPRPSMAWVMAVGLLSSSRDFSFLRMSSRPLSRSPMEGYGRFWISVLSFSRIPLIVNLSTFALSSLMSALICFVPTAASAALRVASSDWVNSALNCSWESSAKTFCLSSGNAANSEINAAGIFMAAEVSAPARRAFKAAFRTCFLFFFATSFYSFWRAGIC
ncbi:hypothetical protein ES703_80279 [subsurface metagenome]